MVVSSPLFGIVDSLLAAAQGGSNRRCEYTPIENRLIGKVVMMALDVLKDAWGRFIRRLRLCPLRVQSRLSCCRPTS